jgi:hypothetical protein
MQRGKVRKLTQPRIAFRNLYLDQLNVTTLSSICLPYYNTFLDNHGSILISGRLVSRLVCSCVDLTFSFNSSGATIVPDDNENGLRYPTRSRLSGGTARAQNIPPLVAQARMLMPDDTLGHELEAMTGMSNGNLGDDGSVNGQNWPHVSTHYYHVEVVLTRAQLSGLDRLDQSATTNSQSTQPIPLSFSGILQFPSSPPTQANELFEPELNQQNLDITSQFESQFPHPSSYNHFGNIDNFRPSSAQSHNTSNSEYSFSSTDVDNDSVMSESNPQPQARNAHLGVDLGALDMSAGQPGHGQNFWNYRQQLGQDTQPSNGRTLMPDAIENELRTVAPDSVSPRDGVSSTGPMRGQSEDPIAKMKQIERESFV